jgi:hypothetical protein
MKKVMGLLIPVLALFLTISLSLSTAHAKTKYKSANVSMNGSCFKLVMTSKKACSGKVSVSWWNKGKGYTLNDSYSMIKNGKEVISGCYEDSRATPGAGAVLSAALKNPTKRYCVIQLYGKTVKTMKW